MLADDDGNHTLTLTYELPPSYAKPKVNASTR